MQNNLTRVEKIVIIVTVVAVFMVFGGIGYAFFTMNDNTGSTAEITNTSGKMTITYADGGSNLLVSDNIVPSDVIIANKTFTLTGVNTASAGDGISMPYKVGLKYTSSFSDGQIHYYIKKVNSTNEGITTTFMGETNQTVPGNDTYTGYSHGTLKNGNNKYTEMVTGEFPASSDSQTITFNLVMQFPDTGENQDTEKGKSINAEIMVNYEPNSMIETLNTLYKTNAKDENGITLDGLQKDGTGDFNITLLNSTNKKYSVSLLNDLNLIADTETDEYDNLRYVGANPNNYILFNNEMWRIIGIFNVYNNDTNTTEKLVKIIRNESLGDYSWDTSKPDINDGFGINEWSKADLMTELNTDYIDTSKTSGTTTWYNGWIYNEDGIYDYSNNIKSVYIEKIANVRWNLGGYSNDQSSAKNYYIAERGTTHVSNPSDGITRTNTWDGKIALMYPSDFGYASINASCRSDLNSINCKNNNWLFNNTHQWMLSPYSKDPSVVFFAYSAGGVDGDDANQAHGVRPVLFLKSDIQIIGGMGTESNPYVID